MSLVDKNSTDEKDTYLVFSIGGDYFASKILEFKEVTGELKIIPVSNTKDYFLGVVNLRGELIGVVDLRIKYGFKKTEAAKQCFVVVETKKGKVITVVDKVYKVLKLSDKQIEMENKFVTFIPSEYVIGITNDDNSIITLVKFGEMLANEEINIPSQFERTT